MDCDVKVEATETFPYPQLLVILFFIVAIGTLTETVTIVTTD